MTGFLLKIKYKIISDSNGFTLLESIFSVLFVSLSGLLIAASICVGVNTYKTVSIRCDALQLLNKYSETVRYAISGSDFVKDDGNANRFDSGLVFSFSDYGEITGRFDIYDGEIVIRPVSVTEDGITDKKEIINLIPGREHYIGSGTKEKFTSEIFIKEKGIAVNVLIKINYSQFYAERDFNVIPVNRLIKGAL